MPMQYVFACQELCSITKDFSYYIRVLFFFSEHDKLVVTFCLRIANVQVSCGRCTIPAYFYIIVLAGLAI